MNKQDAVLVAALICPLVVIVGAAQKPHVLLIVADDYGRTDIIFIRLIADPRRQRPPSSRGPIYLFFSFHTVFGKILVKIIGWRTYFHGWLPR